MKKHFCITVFALLSCVFAQAAVTCTFVTLQIDTNEFLPLDVDGDGANDFIVQTAYTPYVNNFIVGLNGNEIEVTASSGVNADRCRRIESGDPVGSLAWNDTAYMIKNGQGSFSGGSEEYGHVGLRLNKGGNYHHAFLEVRAPYWQALVAVYTIGYNDVAGDETRTDACPLGVEEYLQQATIALSEKQLFVSTPGAAAGECELMVYNITGQMILRERLLKAESVVSLYNMKSGAYIAVVKQEEKILQKNKFTVAE